MTAGLQRPGRLLLAATLVVCVGLADVQLAGAATAPTTTVVDDFTTAQSLTAAAGAQAQGFVTGTPDSLLGGTRSVTLSAPGPGGATVGTSTVDGAPDLVLASGGAQTATSPGPVLTLDYAGAGATDPAGLGAVDLTDGSSHSAIALPAAASTAGVSATLTVGSGPGRCSSVTVPVPVDPTPGTGSAALVLRFGALERAGDCAAAADPTQVEEVTLQLDATAAPRATVVLRGAVSAAVDYGDLPQQWGDTTAAEGGAEAVVDPTLKLGSLLGGEADGTHSDDSSADAHDDGVTLAHDVEWTAAGGGGLDVAVSGTGCVSVWLGLAPGSSLLAQGDNVVSRDPVTTGTVTLTFPLPSTFTAPARVVGRVRLFPRDLDGSCSSVESLDDASSAGEVEDYVFDVSAAPAPIAFTVSPASPSASRAPSWQFTRPSGTEETCTLTGPTGALLASAACDRGFTAKLDGDPDGAYTLQVAATDQLGRAAPPAVGKYVLATGTPATPEITGGPASPTRQSSLSWSFTLPPGTTGQCQLSGPVVVLAGKPCSSGSPVDLTGRPDGSYTFSVVARDAAGNVSAASSEDFVRDATPPGAATFTSTPAPTISTTSPSWTFTFPAADAAVPQCRFTGPAGLIQDWTSCPGTFSRRLGADGSYSLDVRGVDAAGNVGPFLRSGVTLDTLAPVTTITATPAIPGRAPVLTWQFATGDTSAAARCELAGPPGAAAAAFTACAGTASYDETASPDGTYTFTVQATDAAGNIGPAATSQVVLDRVAPATPVITPPPTPRNDPTVQWGLSGDGSSVLSCQLTGPGGTISAATPCGATATYDLSAEPDGAYTLTVSARDQAGNSSADVASSVTLDRDAPGLHLDSSPVGPAQNRRPAWAFHGGDDDTLQCRLALSGGAVVIPFSPCASPFDADLSHAADGSYTLSVRSLDNAGNVTGPVSSSYVLDTTAPAPPTVVASPQTPGDSRAPTWRFVAEAGAIVACRTLVGAAGVTGGGTPLTDWAPCSASWTANLNGRPDGDYTFQVRATDPSGNVGVPADALYTLDTLARAPLVTSAPLSPGHETQVTWAFSLDPDEIATCALVDGDKVAQSPTACASPVTENLTGLPDGQISLVIVASDAAGNISPLTESSYLLVTTLPPSPTLTGNPASPGTSRSPTWSFTTPEGTLDSCRMVQNGIGISSWSPCAGSVSGDLTGLADGSYTVEIRATDLAGNTSPEVYGAAYQLLTGMPATPVITRTPGAGGPLALATWSFTTPPGTTTSCRLLEGSTVVSDWSPCSGQASYALAAIPDGTLLFYLRSTDAVDDAGPSASAAFVLDRTPPGVPVLTDSARSGAAGVVSWHFSDDPGSTTTCQVVRSDGVVITPYGPCTMAYSLDLSSHGAGTYTFSVRATDTWGNVSAAEVAQYAYAPPVLPPRTEFNAGGVLGLAPPEAGKTVPARIVLPAQTENQLAGAKPKVVPVQRLAQPAQPRAPPAQERPPVAPPAQQAAGHPDDGVGPLGLPPAVGRVLSETTTHVALPLGLIVLVLLFLGFQDRLDRGDPKLTSAPLTARVDWAEFR